MDILRPEHALEEKTVRTTTIYAAAISNLRFFLINRDLTGYQFSKELSRCCLSDKLVEKCNHHLPKPTKLSAPFLMLCLRWRLFYLSHHNLKRCLETMFQKLKAVNKYLHPA